LNTQHTHIVANLKNIWKRLVPLLHGLPFVMVYNSTLRKHQIVETLLSLIYADYPTCKTWRPDVLAILRARMTARVPVSAVPTTTAAATAQWSTVAAAVPPQSVRQYPPLAPRLTASMSVPRLAPASTASNRTGPALNDTDEDTFDRMVANISDPAACSAAPTPPPPTNHPPDSVHHPSNASIVAQLRRMGFGINEEIEASIRRLRSQSQMITAHACMLQIIAQREEREEARQMDEARKQSEITRKAESARRRAEIKLQRERDELAADWKAWTAKHFAKSVLLKHGGVRQAWDKYLQQHPRVRKLFWKLLQLEQQALKWYGNLPRPYLESLCSELVATNRRSEFLDETIALLEEQMYCLTNQDCEAPRLFRQYQGRSLGIAEKDDGPEIIEIL